MGIFDGCLLASDIDGTLLADDGIINERCIEKIKFFVKEGGVFSVATGRSAGAISIVLSSIDCLSASVVANGAVIFDYSKKEVLHQFLLDDEDKKIARMIIEMGKDVGIEIHCGDKAYLLSRNVESDEHERYENFTAKPVDFENASSLAWNKVIYMFSDPADINCVKEMLKTTDCNSDFFDTTAFIYGRQRFYFEQVPKNVSKAGALKKLCELLEINDGGFFAIGDFYNDVPMLRIADVSAAPENSPDDIKDIVDVVVSSAKDGAVADFIDYLTGRKTENDR